MGSSEDYLDSLLRSMGVPAELASPTKKETAPAKEPEAEKPEAVEDVPKVVIAEETPVEEAAPAEEVIEELAVEEPVIEESVNEVPVVETSVIEETVAEEPVIEEVVVEAVETAAFDGYGTGTGGRYGGLLHIADLLVVAAADHIRVAVGPQSALHRHILQDYGSAIAVVEARLAVKAVTRLGKRAVADGYAAGIVLHPEHLVLRMAVHINDA